jgi:hypothetical protein
VAAGAGEAPDVGDAAHAVALEQGAELLERVRRVADREGAPPGHGAKRYLVS